MKIINMNSIEPHMFEWYYPTKADVHSFDHICFYMSHILRTGKSPMCIFNGMTLIESINSYIVLFQNLLIASQKPISLRYLWKTTFLTSIVLVEGKIGENIHQIPNLPVKIASRLLLKVMRMEKRDQHLQMEKIVREKRVGSATSEERMSDERSWFFVSLALKKNSLICVSNIVLFLDAKMVNYNMSVVFQT